MEGAAAMAEAFRAEIDRVAAEEMRRGVTLVGPQRDDLQFLINEADARTYGSQGQQRTVILALKLAEFRLIEEYIGEPPIMLLDDVMSDLDDARQKHLLRWMRRRCQTFLTCTNLRVFPEELLSVATIYHVSAGTIGRNGAAPSS
jgi:DNA replication and repair protein RecF